MVELIFEELTDYVGSCVSLHTKAICIGLAYCKRSIDEGFGGRKIKYEKNNIEHSNVVPHRSTTSTRPHLTSMSRRVSVFL